MFCVQTRVFGVGLFHRPFTGGRRLASLVVYSSQTGNTQSVAEAIASALPKPVFCCPVLEAPDPADFDFVAIGFWAEFGRPDTHSRNFMRKLKRKRVGAFGTMGGDPKSVHGLQLARDVRLLLRRNYMETLYLCQGRIDVKVIENLLFTGKNLPGKLATPEQWARIEDSRSHPNEADLQAAADAFGSLKLTMAAG